MTNEEKMVHKFRESGKSQREWCREAGDKTEHPEVLAGTKRRN